jgi:hypothetical protein
MHMGAFRAPADVLVFLLPMHTMTSLFHRVWLVAAMASSLANPRGCEWDSGAMEPRIQYAQTADGR